jgi:hypothetical protein
MFVDKINEARAFSYIDGRHLTHSGPDETSVTCYIYWAALTFLEEALFLGFLRDLLMRFLWM